MTLTAPVAVADSNLERDRLNVFDLRRLTAPYPVTPLLVLMSFNFCLLMSGMLVVLQFIGIQNSYHSELVALTGAVAQQVQLGLGPDLPVAVAANRRGNLWRTTVGGMVVLAAFSFLLAMAGVQPSTVLLYFGVFLAISVGGALTSTQHGALSQYYPPEIRTRAILAHRFVGVSAIALAAPVAYLFGLGFGWQAPIFALAGLALVLAFIGSRLLPVKHQGPLDQDQNKRAEAPATIPEAARVLFSVPSIRTLYRALPLLSVCFFGISYYAGLLYLNVFHQNANTRRLELDFALVGGAAGVLVAALLLPKLLRTDPNRGMRMVVRATLIACLATIVIATSPAAVPVFVADIVFTGAAAFIVAGIYATLSIAVPQRLVTLGFALSSLWFTIGVLIVGPVGTVGSTFAATIGNDFGFRATFWLFTPLILLGTTVLRRTSRCWPTTSSASSPRSRPTSRSAGTGSKGTASCSWRGVSRPATTR